MGMRRAAMYGWAALAFAVSAGAPGCVPSDTAPPDPGVAVSTPPPPDHPEGQPPTPVAGSTWVPGYWHWIGDRWAWVPGHWERPPPGSRSWRAPRYSVRDGQYRYEAGGWVSH